MMQYIFSPRWFYGIDIIFELFSILIVILLARYGHRLYRITSDKKHKYFSVFFLLVGIAFAFKIIANFDIYYLDISSLRIENAMFYFETSHISEILFAIGFSVFRFLMMLAFFGLFFISVSRESRPGLFYLCAYFIAVIAIFSQSAYYIFHLTMFVILSGLLSCYMQSYAKKRPANSELFLTSLSFLMLLFSQAAFAAITLDLVMYVVGEVLQLAGFSVLLYEYILVTRYEK